MRKYVFVAVLLFFMFAPLFAQSGAYSDYIIVNKYNEAIKIAEFTEKPLMILFSMATCKDCVDFKEKTLMQEEVMQFLKERFIIVDVQPYPHLHGIFPLGSESAGEYSYAELFVKYSVKRTPTTVFFDNDFYFIDKTTGYYDSDSFIDIISQFDEKYDYPSSPELKAIDKDMAVLILDTMPNSKLLDLGRFESEYESLNVLDYYVIENTDLSAVRNLLQKKDNRLKNLFVYETNLEYVHQEQNAVTDLSEEGNWTNLNGEQAVQVLDENEENDDFYIFDVRTEEEYLKGHIKNSLNLDFFSEDFKERLSEYDRTSTYFVYCQSGGRSVRAVKMMEELGFEYIYHYEGGYSNWVEK
ncbi:MAG TPA: rhodanese-like domain-containing protein [Thermotogota bacterium]|nr:rhodanese-like domain-containing protein [Thermotogota bacterium]